MIWIRSGWLRGSIYWVLIVSGRFAVTKPLSQIQRSTLWPLQDTNLTPSISGFGVSGGDKVGRVGGGFLSIGDLIVYRLPSFIGLLSMAAVSIVFRVGRLLLMRP